MSESNIAPNPKLDKANSDENGKERKRRTRNQVDGRNFSCSCGKSYLSYPALYTHIKTKHNGKSQFSRGSILRQDNSEDIKEEEQEEVQKNQDTNNMETLRKYLTKFFPFSQKDKEIQRKVKELSKQDQLYMKNIKEYWEKHKKQDEFQVNQTYGTFIDNVFGRFLLDIEGEVSKNCQRFLQEFIINVRNGLNLMQNDKYCKNNCAGNLPTLMNTLFIEHLQKMEESHLYSRHPTIPCKIIFHFCRWLFQQKFTNQSLKFNTV